VHLLKKRPKAMLVWKTERLPGLRLCPRGTVHGEVVFNTGMTATRKSSRTLLQGADRDDDLSPHRSYGSTPRTWNLEDPPRGFIVKEYQPHPATGAPA